MSPIYTFKNMTIRKFEITYAANILFLVDSSILDGAAHH